MKVVYNGITIEHALTTSWEETVKYDSSGMNLIGSEITLTFEGSVFGDGYGTRQSSERPDVDVDFPLALTSATLGSRLNVVLRQLSYPRRSLVVFDNINPNDAIFQAFPQDGNDVYGGLTETQKRNIDVDGGPKPVSVRVLQVANDWAHISFTIKVVKIRCLGGEINAPNALGSDPTKDFVVSNRCHTEETIDHNFYTTRTYAGKLTISSANDSVLYYRELFYPPLELGFRRESVRFSESEDGLSLSYSIVDKQVRCAAPYPATAFDGNVTFTVQNGAKLGFEINLNLIGRPDCDKRVLVSLALQAVTRKIFEFSKVGNGFYELFRVSENLDDPPQVSVAIRSTLYVKTKGTKDDKDAWPNLAQALVPAIEIIGEPIDFEGVSDAHYNYAYDRFQSHNPSPWGYNVFCAYSQDKDENKEASDRFKGFEYIKCLASVPCALPVDSVVFAPVDSPATTAMGESLSTIVTQDPPGQEYRVHDSEITDDAVKYAYSLYKSDIQYSTGQGAFVAPHAEPAPSGNRVTTTRADAATQLTSADSTIAALRTQIAELEAQILGSSGLTTDPGEAAAAANAQSELAQLYAQLRTALQTRSKYALELNCSEILRVARPQPRATVTIEAERYGRLPEMPDPEKIVSVEVESAGVDPIVFTPISHTVKIAEPQQAVNTDEVRYYATGVYEYALSRPHRDGDVVKLLTNPIFDDACYFPKTCDERGNVAYDQDALAVLYKGKQLEKTPTGEYLAYNPLVDPTDNPPMEL